MDTNGTSSVHSLEIYNDKLHVQGIERNLWSGKESKKEDTYKQFATVAVHAGLLAENLEI